MDIKKLKYKAKILRQKTFNAFIEKGEAHLGGSFSMIETLLVIYEVILKKKNPLVMPPKFMELPKPQEENNEDEIAELEENVDIKTILELEKSSNKSSKNSGSAEDFVLKQLEDK